MAPLMFHETGGRLYGGIPFPLSASLHTAVATPNRFEQPFPHRRRKCSWPRSLMVFTDTLEAAIPMVSSLSRPVAMISPREAAMSLAKERCWDICAHLPSSASWGLVRIHSPSCLGVHLKDSLSASLIGSSLGAHSQDSVNNLLDVDR